MNGATATAPSRQARRDWLDWPVWPCAALCALATLLALAGALAARSHSSATCAGESAASPYVLPLAGAGVDGGRIDLCGSAIARDGSHAYRFEVPLGTPVVAARAGTVIRVVAGRSAAAGEAMRATYVNVRHDDGTIAAYVHLQPASVRVAAGDRIAQGGIIGLSGEAEPGVAPAVRFAVQGCLDCGTIPVAFRVAGGGSPPVG
jgi:hypothetical protein